MSKFGELIDIDKPVLLMFYVEGHELCAEMHLSLRDVAANLGDKAKVIKIDCDRNQELSEALRVNGLPTIIIYLKGEMKWRRPGLISELELMEVLKEYTNETIKN